MKRAAADSDKEVLQETPAVEPTAEDSAGVAAETTAADGAEADEEATVDPGARRRPRMLLLALLTALATCMLAFVGWYLILRKPISEFPIPLPSSAQMPGYGYAFYDITRPTGIAVTADGSRIYVVQSEGDTAVLAFDAKGNKVATMTPPDARTDHVFVYVAVSPISGDVYVTDRPTSSVYVYAADGTYKRTLDAPGSAAGWQPLGVSFDSVGDLLVTDAGSGQVYEFDPQGAVTRTIGQTAQFNFPNSVTVDATSRLYIADSNNGRIVVLGPTGEQVAVVRRGRPNEPLGMPRGLALDDQGRLYVVDTIGQKVNVFQVAPDLAGQPSFLGSFGEMGIADGAFRFPNGVSTDARGRVYIADWSNNRVQIWTY